MRNSEKTRYLYFFSYFVAGKLDTMRTGPRECENTNRREGSAASRTASDGSLGPGDSRVRFARPTVYIKNKKKNGTRRDGRQTWGRACAKNRASRARVLQ